MTEIPTYIVDSFTDEPFKGNPAGVCLLMQDLPENLMLKMAKELGFSETAFVRKREAKNSFSIRYFSPKMEIPLCGHATLAASKVLFHENTDLDTIHFQTIQDLDLFIQKSEDFIKMEFPIYETFEAEAPSELPEALGTKKILNSVYNPETKILLLEIADCEVLQGLKPDFEALLRSVQNINGVLVTAPSSKNDFDFESRYFWPWSGTNEDPVTGGTHTFLAKYWSTRLNKLKMNSFQCSERSGFMEVELISPTKLTIKSKARVVLKGMFNV